MPAGAGLPNLLDLPGEIVDAIGAAIRQGITDAASWAIGGMTHALVATTAVDFTGWFQGPWRAMLTLGALASAGVLLVGVIHGALTGRAGELARRGVLAPLAVALLAGPGALGAAGALVEATSAACRLVVAVALGQGGYAGAFTRLLGGVSAGGAGMPGAVAVLFAMVVGVLAFVVWVELAVRAAAIYLVVAFLPLGLAGMFWGPAVRFLRRLVAVFVALVASQLVITVVMVLAAAALGGTGPAATVRSAGLSLSALVSGVALLLLGSVSLPVALRLVPHAAEAALAHGAGARALSSGARSLAAEPGLPPAVSRLAQGGAAGGLAGMAVAGAGLAAGAVRRGASVAGQAGSGAGSPGGSGDQGGGPAGSTSPGAARPGDPPPAPPPGGATPRRPTGPPSPGGEGNGRGDLGGHPEGGPGAPSPGGRPGPRPRPGPPPRTASPPAGEAGGRRDSDG